MKIRNALQASLIATAAVGFVLPAAAAPLPQPVQEGNATYISGGVGADEEQAIKSEAKNYDLQVSNSDKTGHFVTDTNFEITSKDGRERIAVDGAGPLFYAKLPAGEYTVRATNGNEQTERNVRISAGKAANMSLVWKNQS